MATTDTTDTSGTKITDALIIATVMDALEQLVEKFNRQNDSQVAIGTHEGHEGQPKNEIQLFIDCGGRYGAKEIDLKISEL